MARSRTAPDWPALMRGDLAALYLDMTAAEFSRAVDAGHLPQPVMPDRWSRAEIDTFLDRLTGAATPDWRQQCKLFKRDAA